MKLVPVKQAQTKLFNAPADKGAEVAHAGDVQKGPLPRPQERDGRGLAPRRGRLREERALPCRRALRQAPCLLKGGLQARDSPSANAYLAEVR